MQKAKKMLTGSVLALIIVFFMVFYTDSHKMLVYGENLDETAEKHSLWRISRFMLPMRRR